MRISRHVGVSAVFVAPFVAAYWRMQCMGVSGIAQIDPLVNPNMMSPHAHTVKGGSAMSVSAGYSDLLKSDCTSCQVQQDKSAYWTPQLYFMHTNGSAQLVNEVPGHITYYKYTPVYNHNGTLMMPQALPNGLRILAGNAMRRNFTLSIPDPPRPWSGSDATQDALAQKAVGFNCLNYQKTPEDSLYRHFLPDKAYLEANCTAGVRAEMLFPQCWNGQLDSPDHQSHMAYADSGINGGRCPEGYDFNIMQIFYETIFPTGLHVNDAGYYAFANGDPTGYGYHGDLMVAWDEGVLQSALTQCGSDTTGDGVSGVTADCPVFKMNDQAAMSTCKLASAALIPYDLAKSTMLAQLPGSNPVQTGPAQATKPPVTATIASDPTSLASSIVPTQAYSQGMANILVAQQAGTTSSPTPSPSSASVTSAQQTTLQSVAIPSSASPPATTPAPALPAAGNIEQVLTTMTYTTNGAVINEVLVADEVVVTVEDVVTVSVPARKGACPVHHRHADAHARGNLGRRNW